MSRDDCSSSTVSVFNNTDHSEFYEHSTATKQEHRERVSKPGGGGGEYYERAGSQVGSDYYEVSKKQQQGHNGSEYYAPLRLPVNCSPPEVELRTTSHSVGCVVTLTKTTFFIYNQGYPNPYNPGEGPTGKFLCRGECSGDESSEGGGAEGR